MPFKKYLLILFLSLLAGLTKAQTVYKTPSGAKYHLSSCRMVKNVSKELTISEAQALGLAPCKICNPPGNFIDKTTIVHKAQGQSATVQCNGFTKTGTRCRHMTKIANSFCFQHQP
jgi:hypothetical protein